MCALLLCAFAAPLLDLHGDALPDGAAARLGTVRLRSEESMLAAAFSPDGKTLATSCSQGSVSFWEVPGFKLRLRVRLEGSRAAALRFSPDGMRLYASAGTAIRVIDPATGAERLAIGDPLGGTMGSRIAISPDGSRLLAWPEHGEPPILFDSATGSVLHRLPGLANATYADVAFAPDGKHFVAAWEDGGLHLVRTETGKSVRSLETAARPGRRFARRSAAVAAVTPDGSRVAYRPSQGDQFLVRDLATGRVSRRIAASPDRGGGMGTLALTPDGRLLVEADGGDTIRVHGFASGKLLREVPAPGVRRFSLSPDGRSLAHVAGNAVLVWDLATGRPAPGSGGHARCAHALAFADEGRLASVEGTGWRTWDAATGKPLGHHRGVPLPEGPVRPAQGGAALEFAAFDRVLRRWRVGEGRAQALTVAPRDALRGPTRWAVSPDGKRLAGLRGRDGVVRLVSAPLAEDGTERELASFGDSPVGRPVFSPDGRTLAVAHHGPAISFFDAASGERRSFRWPGPAPEEVETARLSFSPDGRSLVVAATEVRLLESATAGERFRVPGCAAGMCPPAWSGDGRLLALGDADGFAIVLDALTGEEVFRCRTGQGGVAAVALRADGRRLATSGADTTILVWEVQTPKRLAVTGSAEEAWEALRSRDARLAFRGMARLAAEPAALRRFAEAKAVVPMADEARLEALVRDLSDERFVVRAAASRALAALGEAARPALEKAKAGRALEAKRAAEALLAALRDGPAGDRRRALRAAEVLERFSPSRPASAPPDPPRTAPATRP